NECGADSCQSDADCVNGVCVVAGALTYKVRGCMYAACKVNADCTAEPGGECVPVADPCCGNPAGLFCVYPSNGCRSTADCSSGSCGTNGQRAECKAGFPICPA